MRWRASPVSWGTKPSVLPKLRPESTVRTCRLISTRPSSRFTDRLAQGFHLGRQLAVAPALPDTDQHQDAEQNPQPDQHLTGGDHLAAWAECVLVEIDLLHQAPSSRRARPMAR